MNQNHAAETIKGLEFDNVLDRPLLDIWLNDGTGFDAMQAFKTVIPGARFIFMSAEATPEIVGRARALAACGFVGKHLDANAFTAAVRKVLAAAEASRFALSSLVEDETRVDRALSLFTVVGLFRCHGLRNRSRHWGVVHRSRFPHQS